MLTQRFFGRLGVSLAVRPLSLAVLGVCSVCADPRTGGPDLLPLSPATVAVNEQLRLPLPVNNPSGVALTYSVQGPALPGFAEVSDVSGGTSGGEFRWTPLASHVGTHQLTFTVHSSLGDDSESVLITVTPGASAAPVFLRPGAGGTYDLGRDPCVRFDVEVRDDDSPDVTVRLRGEPVVGAQLEQTGPKQADFEWCPRPEQTSVSERWTIGLEADDGDHAPTRHDYLVVLRTNARDNCPGEPPEVTILAPAQGERVVSGAGYLVAIRVTDDVGVRDAPLLYHTTVKPEDPSAPDLADFAQTTFTARGGSSWEALVPPLGLAVGEERTVFFFASATDNDDPTGTACDHRTDTPLREFVAVGGEASDGTANCGLCGASAGCLSGVCAASGGGNGICLPACTPGDGCGGGTCHGMLTVEGGTVNACGDATAYCQGGGECEDDAYEENDTRATARTIGFGTIAATYCDGDPDFYAIVASREAELEVLLDGFDPGRADLDLELLDSAGARLAISAGLGGTEVASTCVAGGDRVVARVYSVVAGSQSDYSLTVTEIPGECCVNDANEPDPFDRPTPIPGHGFFDGMICPGDSDHHSFTITGPTHLDALIVFEHAEADLDMELYGPTGSLIAGSWEVLDEEEISVDLALAGTYTLRIEAYDNGATEYVGQIQLSPLASCASTSSCPVGTVCSNAGLCVSDVCTSSAECPTGYLCPVAGPGGAQRRCVAPCAINGDCRTGEACKRFAEGRGCGRTGSGPNGGTCADFRDCGGQRACHVWPGGYCARLGCTSTADCEVAETFCASVAAHSVCVRRCGDGHPACRIGYQCVLRNDLSGGEAFACVPL
jgi:hypothetical protein